MYYFPNGMVKDFAFVTGYLVCSNLVFIFKIISHSKLHVLFKLQLIFI